MNRTTQFSSTGEPISVEDVDDNAVERKSLCPSFITQHLGQSMVDQENDQMVSEERKINEIQKFTKKQALDELAKARPVATVFFRFSHRDD